MRAHLSTGGAFCGPRLAHALICRALAVACLAWCVLLQSTPAAGQEMQLNHPLGDSQGGGASSAGQQPSGQQQQGGVGVGEALPANNPAPPSPTKFEVYQHYFALCAVTKDKPGDLREWVDYHHALGVTKFYIFDTDQRVPNGPILQDLIETGTVEYYHLPRVTPRTIPLMQVRLYYLCLKHVSNKHQWLGFWDVDEFLVLNDPSLRFPAFLRQFEPFGGLVINWRLLGSSGHMSRPPGGVLRNFLKCTPEGYHENHQVKTIVNTKWVHLPTTDPHHFAYKEGKFAVNTNFEKVDGAVNVAIRDDRLTLFHYALKSAGEYLEKMRKGSAMGNYKNMLFFHRIDEAAVETCTQAVDACRKWGLSWCSDEPDSAGVAGHGLPWRKHHQIAGTDSSAQWGRQEQKGVQQQEQGSGKGSAAQQQQVAGRAATAAMQQQVQGSGEGSAAQQQRAGHGVAAAAESAQQDSQRGWAALQAQVQQQQQQQPTQAAVAGAFLQGRDGQQAQQQMQAAAGAGVLLQGGTAQQQAAVAGVLLPQGGTVQQQAADAGVLSQGGATQQMQQQAAVASVLLPQGGTA